MADENTARLTYIVNTQAAIKAMSRLASEFKKMAAVANVSDATRERVELLMGLELIEW